LCAVAIIGGDSFRVAAAYDPAESSASLHQKHRGACNQQHRM